MTRIRFERSGAGSPPSQPGPHRAPVLQSATLPLVGPVVATRCGAGIDDRSTAGPDVDRRAQRAGLVMAAIFLGSWGVQLIAGWAAFNETRLQNLQDPLSLGTYALNADFWARTLQNWQSEFLAVGSMAILAVYLRQRGSPESKPVDAPHSQTGTD